MGGFFSIYVLYMCVCLFTAGGQAKGTVYVMTVVYFPVLVR